MSMPELVFTKTISESLKNYCQSNNITKAIVLCDSNTLQFCFPLISDLDFKVLSFSKGEESKTIEEALKIIDQLLDLQSNRQTVLINLGGGVVSDLGGFVASVFMRGIEYINVPTSLLAMVDAAIGGKTGIDYRNYKNLIGSFKQPKAVFISEEFLKTLPEIEKRSAWSEVIKTASIASAELFQLIENNSQLSQIIELCARTKSNLTEMDYTDQGVRQLLNFGHTIGHAYESYFLEINSPVKHGDAVAYGMLREIRLALNIGSISEIDFSRISQAIKDRVGLVYQNDDLFDSYCKYLLADKKNKNSMISFSIPKSIGNGQFQWRVSMDDLKKWKIEGII